MAGATAGCADEGSAGTDAAGATGAAAPTEAPAAPTPSPEVAPSGFGTVQVRLTEPDGSTCERCLLLADDPDLRSRGLMGVTTLGGYDGMLFRYAEPTRTSFWMKDTVLPLTIRFYDEGGLPIAAFDMAPCDADPCPSYGPDLPFTVAVEVEQGWAEALGFTPTAVLEVLAEPCPAAGSA